MAVTTSALERPSRLVHFTPLRYPGGKGKLAPFVKSLLKANSLLDGEYIEPYAGGAAVALELLLHEYVSRIHINDVSLPIFSFWKAVLDHTEELNRRIVSTALTVKEWDRQKAVMKDACNHDLLDVGFATFFLNRTNRSGILNGGIIGGRDQSGPWKIDARYNAKELAHRISSIARMRSRISLTRKDAVSFLSTGTKKWPLKSLVYLDPPYFVKGRELYYDFYSTKDHAEVASLVCNSLRQPWIVSYDNVPDIRSLYAGERSMTYDIGYSARSAKKGSEVMFFADKLAIPSANEGVQRTLAWN